jgi:hypothetical protein
MIAVIFKATLSQQLMAEYASDYKTKVSLSAI